jgi:hypothetical protein
MERDAVPAECAVREFLNICLAEDCLAVHCWDWCCNTQTMVALWLMRALKFSSSPPAGGRAPPPARLPRALGTATPPPGAGNTLRLPAPATPPLLL